MDDSKIDKQAISLKMRSLIEWIYNQNSNPIQCHRISRITDWAQLFIGSLFKFLDREKIYNASIWIKNGNQPSRPFVGSVKGSIRNSNLKGTFFFNPCSCLLTCYVFLKEIICFLILCNPSEECVQKHKHF